MNKAIALAYVNEKNEIVGWSADSFGSPYKYPKIYSDSESTRKMLNEKFSGIQSAYRTASEVLGKLNPYAAIYIEDGADSTKSFFKKNNVVGARIVRLNVPYEGSGYNKVKECIDNQDYEFYEVETV